MSTNKKLLNSKAVSFIDETEQFLSELITFKSVGGSEIGAMEYLYGRFSEFDSTWIILSRTSITTVVLHKNLTIAIHRI